jgi:hypothetical protein
MVPGSPERGEDDMQVSASLCASSEEMPKRCGRGASEPKAVRSDSLPFGQCRISFRNSFENPSLREDCIGNDRCNSLHKRKNR